MADEYEMIEKVRIRAAADDLLHALRHLPQMVRNETNRAMLPFAAAEHLLPV